MKKGNPVPIHVRAIDKDGKLTQAMVRLLQDQQKLIERLEERIDKLEQEVSSV